MYEQLRNDFMVALLDENESNVESALRAFDSAISRYTVNKRETDIVVYENDIPDVLKTYLVCKKMSGLSDATLNSYKTILTMFFREIRKSPECITTNEIRRFLYMYQESKGVSSRTIDKYREYISRFFSWAHDEGYLESNPTKNITAIKYEERPREALTQVELEYVRMACDSLRDRAIIEFLYSTGARVSELTAVKKADINWYEKSVHLFGKGRKHRTSFLNAKAEVALIQYLESRDDDSEYLFVSSRKPYKQLTKHGVERVVRIISDKVSNNVGKHITPHILRHTTATTALHSGMPIADISKLLGHESVDTTMIYAKASMDEVRNGHKKHIV